MPERRALESIKADPAFVELLNRARANHMVVDGTPPDPNAYELCWGAFWSPQGMQLPSSNGAVSAAACLKRKSDPKRLAVSLDLTNGAYHEMALGGMQWSAIVPGHIAPKESVVA